MNHGSLIVSSILQSNRQSLIDFAIYTDLDTQELTANQQQVQSQLVLDEDAIASWDSLRDVRPFEISPCLYAPYRLFYSHLCRMSNNEMQLLCLLNFRELTVHIKVTLYHHNSLSIDC